MKTFELHLVEDETGISGTGIVAQGTEFDDGSVAMRWLTNVKSSALYASMRDVEAIHGHAGKTKVIYVGQPFDRGMKDCVQDSFENCPFASVGGLDKRKAMVVPRYISMNEADSYLKGYQAAAQLMYGEDWAPAITLGATAAEVAPAS